MRSAPFLNGFIDLHAEECRHQAFDDITRDIRQHRHDERRLEADIHDEHHRDEAADVRHGDADDDIDECIPLEARTAALERTDDRIHDDPGKDIAARRTKQLAEARRAADEDRQPDHAQKRVDEQGDQRLLRRQHESRHAECQRQRRDHARRERQWEGDIRRHAAERHAERYLSHIPCCD